MLSPLQSLDLKCAVGVGVGGQDQKGNHENNKRDLKGVGREACHLTLLSTTTIKHCDRKQLRQERVNLAHSSTSLTEVRQGPGSRN